MLTYDVDGPILTIVGNGFTSDAERFRFYMRVRSDNRVPDAALLLLDGRRAEPVVNRNELESLARTIAQLLGPKAGKICAVLLSDEPWLEVAHFHAAATTVGVRVEVFTDEAAARAWLLASAKRD